MRRCPLSAVRSPCLALIQSVSVLLTDRRATCSAHNVYPAPQVTWSTEPPSAQEALENSTISTADHRGLFHVESTLRILGNLSNYTYVCSVTSADKTQVWTSSWKNQGVLTAILVHLSLGGSCLRNKGKTLLSFQTVSHMRRVLRCPSPAPARTLSRTSPSPGPSRHWATPQSS